MAGVADLEALEEFEMAQDLAAYREAKANDDGQRVPLEQLHTDLRPRPTTSTSPQQP